VEVGEAVGQGVEEHEGEEGGGALPGGQQQAFSSVEEHNLDGTDSEHSVGTHINQLINYLINRLPAYSLIVIDA
jgi:hypothetical protein